MMKAPIFLLPLVCLFLSVVMGQAQVLQFTELVPGVLNTSKADQDEDFPSYVLLRAFEAVDISGWYLTDDANSPRKWQFPDGYSLGPGDEVIVYASTKDRRPPGGDGELHANFQFPCTVPFVGVYRDTQQGTLDLVVSSADQTNYCVCDGLPLIGSGTEVRYIVPNDNVQGNWTLGNYSGAANWPIGALCLGYDDAPNMLCDGLVLYEPLDSSTLNNEVSKDVSDSPNNHDGFPQGDGWQVVTAKVKEGMQITTNGGGFIAHEIHPELDPGKDQDFAVSVWVRADVEFPPNNGIQVIASNGAYEPERPGWMIYRRHVVGAGYSSGVRLIGAQKQYDIVLPTLEDDAWHHLAFTVCASGSEDEFQAYFDGQALQAPVPLPDGEDFNTSGNGDRLFIGIDEPGRQFIGTLDDVAIWNKKLSTLKIEEVYQAGNSGLSFKTAQGVGGLGKYDPYIGRDVEAEMKGIRSSLYVRAPFSLSQFPGAGAKLTLRMRYDDGFAAYLNGTLVLRRNAPTALSENSRATKNREDCLALSPETFELDASLLQQGNNLLAIHALNFTPNQDRFIICPELCLEPGQQEDDPDYPECVKTNRGKEFWLAFPENYEEEPGAPIDLSLCIVGKPGETGFVSVPGMAVPGFPKPFTIGTSGKAVVSVPSSVELSGQDDREAKGIRVVANTFVTIYAQNHIDYSTDGYLGLPLDCLGTDYVVLTYPNVQSNLPILQGSQFAVVAPYNNTTVTITPKETIGTHTAGVPFDVVLQRGETYQLRNESNSPAGVTGTCINADKPVGVFGSHRCANIQSPNQFYCDTLLEQLLPEGAWGGDYRLAPYATRTADTVRVTGAKDSTFFQIHSSAPSPTDVILDRGEVYEFTLDEPMTILGQGQLSVAQFSNSSDFDGNVDSDPFMALVQSTDTWLRRYNVCTPSTAQFPKSYATVIAPTTANLSNVMLDGNPIPLTDAGTLPLGAAYARFELPSSTTGVYRFASERSNFALTIYGFDTLDSYGYPGGFCFQDTQAPVVICPDMVTVSCDGEPCVAMVPNVLQASSAFDNITPSAELFLNQTPPAGTIVDGPAVYTIVVQASDAAGNVGTCNVILNVEDPNSPPQGLSLPLRTPAVNGPEGTIDITQGFIDAEQPSETLDYEIFQVLGDVGAFEMIAVDNGTKELVVRCKPNLIGSIDVRVRATDAGGLTGITSQQIQIQGTPYQVWLNQEFAPEILQDFGQQVGQWGEQADNDDDENPTLGEAYHGRNPNANDDVPLDTVEFDATTNEWVFNWRRSLNNTGTEADGNWSPNLTDWYEHNDGPPGDARPINITNGAIVDGQRSCEARIPGEADERIFFRLTYRVANP